MPGRCGPGHHLGAKGQTPVLAVSGQRQGINAASAISAKGAFWLATYHGGLTGERFVTLLSHMMRGRRHALHLILDNLPAHKTKGIQQYVAGLGGKLTLHYLPGYDPDLLQKGKNLDERVRTQLAEIGRQSALVRSFFRHPSAAYISDF
jgi:transposase